LGKIIVGGVFDGNVDTLHALIVDHTIDEFIREALLGAVTFLAWERRIDRDRLLRFLERFYDERLAADGDHAWYGSTRAIALLDLRHMGRWSTTPGATAASTPKWSIAAISTRTSPKPNARLTTSIASRASTAVHRRRPRVAGLGQAPRR
jgi:hypothetical protein